MRRHYFENSFTNYEPTALPDYFDSEILKIKLHYDGKIRNFPFFFKNSGTESAFSCSQGILKRQITLDEFQDLIKYRSDVTYPCNMSRAHENVVFEPLISEKNKEFCKLDFKISSVKIIRQGNGFMIR